MLHLLISLTFGCTKQLEKLGVISVKAGNSSIAPQETAINLEVVFDSTLNSRNTSMRYVMNLHFNIYKC